MLIPAPSIPYVDPLVPPNETSPPSWTRLSLNVGDLLDECRSAQVRVAKVGHSAVDQIVVALDAGGDEDQARVGGCILRSEHPD